MSNNDYFNTFINNSLELNAFEEDGLIQLDRVYASYYNYDASYIDTRRIIDASTSEDSYFSDSIISYEFNLDEFNTETNYLKFDLEFTYTTSHSVNSEIVPVKGYCSISFDSIISVLYEYSPVYVEEALPETEDEPSDIDEDEI